MNVGPESTKSGNASFQWRTLALWSFIFGLVSLTALAIVATIARADALSVVALALAVLAFVVQIIVFIVQGNSASQQAADAAALNAQTLRALAAIEAKSEGTRETVGIISDRLLDFALNKAASEADPNNPGEAIQGIDASVLERAQEVIESRPNGGSLSERATPPSISPPSKNALDKTFLDRRLSNSEVGEAAAIINELSKDILSLVSIDYLGKDLLKAEKAGREGQAGLTTVNRAVELHEKGLIKRVKPQWSSKPLLVLSDKGKLVANALLCDPAPMNETILEARRSVEDFLLRVRRSTAAADSALNSIPID